MTLDISRTFGQHAAMRHLVALDPPTVRYDWLEHEVRAIVWESKIIDAFQQRGYRVQFAAA